MHSYPWGQNLPEEKICLGFGNEGTFSEALGIELKSYILPA
jgi:hypothetical protein